jgi:hypothetical protein
MGYRASSSQIETNMKITECCARSFNERWDAFLDELRAVEQLFIAV